MGADYMSRRLFVSTGANTAATRLRQSRGFGDAGRAVRLFTEQSGEDAVGLTYGGAMRGC